MLKKKLSHATVLWFSEPFPFTKNSGMGWGNVAHCKEIVLSIKVTEEGSHHTTVAC